MLITKMTDAPTSTVVLGLGNPLMGDDGLGLVALQQLRGRGPFDPPVGLIDGGTWGMNLLHVVEGANRLLLLDAINVGGTSGAIVELWGDDLPRYLSHKVSPHQIDMREVLAIAELRGTTPTDLVAIGIQPERIDWGVELTGRVTQALPALVNRVMQVLRAWGHVPAHQVIPIHA